MLRRYMKIICFTDCDWSLYVNKKAQKEINDVDNFYELMEKHIEEILKGRKYMIENILKYEIDDDFYYPTNIKRLIQSSQ